MSFTKSSLQPKGSISFQDSESTTHEHQQVKEDVDHDDSLEEEETATSEFAIDTLPPPVSAQRKIDFLIGNDHTDHSKC
jgi:hypothetical protein